MLGRSHILHSEHSTLAHIKYDFIFQIRVNSTILYNLLKEEAILGSFKCIIQLKNLHKRTREFFWDRLKWSIQRALRHKGLHHNELWVTNNILVVIHSKCFSISDWFKFPGWLITAQEYTGQRQGHLRDLTILVGRSLKNGCKISDNKIADFRTQKMAKIH